MGLDLLSVLADREQQERFGRFIKPDTLSPEVKVIIKDIPKYFSDHPSQDVVDWENFSEWFRIVAHSTYKEDKLDTYDKIFTRMSTHTPTELHTRVIEKYILQDYCQQVADIALRGAEGEDVDIDDINAVLDKFNNEVDRVSKLDSFLVSDDLEALVREVVDGGYHWRMQFLNKSIGKIRPGKLVCFAARPNVGKTTFLACEATYFASQMEETECLLWFNNEEAGRDVKLRTVQAAIHKTSEDIVLNPKASLLAYESAIGGKSTKIKLIDKADINIKDVEEFIRQYAPKVVIFDQLWKVHGFEKSSGTDTARLGSVFQWAREMAKKYECAVLTVHQVKTEGEGVEYLTPNLLYLSGTVIQGEVDSLILMGRNYTPGQEANRFITIGKNKGAYGPDVDPSLSEGKVAIMISPRTAEFLEP